MTKFKPHWTDRYVRVTHPARDYAIARFQKFIFSGRVLCLMGLWHAYRPPTDRELMDWVADEHRHHRLVKYQKTRMLVCDHCGITRVFQGHNGELP